jgi:Protein of unknown function (DUF2917)
MESHSMTFTATDLTAVLRAPLAGRGLMRGAGCGHLSVLEGRVWMTRSGDLDDHLLVPGDRIGIEGTQGLVLEPWAGDRAIVRWEPAPQVARLVALRGRAAAWGGALLFALSEVFGGTARALRRTETALAALARKAASNARRAQGCIRAGDSIALSGALK